MIDCRDRKSGPPLTAYEMDIPLNHPTEPSARNLLARRDRLPPPFREPRCRRRSPLQRKNGRNRLRMTSMSSKANWRSSIWAFRALTSHNGRTGLQNDQRFSEDDTEETQHYSFVIPLMSQNVTNRPKPPLKL